MSKKILTPELLKKHIKPHEWYEYRDLIKLLPVSSTTIVRLLDRTPHTIIKKVVEGSAIPYPRKIRIFPGSAIIDASYSTRSKTTKILEHESGGNVPRENETGSESQGD